jgi:hypothetical protein
LAADGVGVKSLRAVLKQDPSSDAIILPNRCIDFRLAAQA